MSKQPDHNHSSSSIRHTSSRTRTRAAKPATATAAATKPALLPAENDLEIHEPGTSGETLNQRRLREFYELQNTFFDLRDRYVAAYARLQEQVMKGAAIQTGSYKVKSGIRLVRRPRYKQIVIDLKGEQYQQRLLENTPPHAHFRVRIE